MGAHIVHENFAVKAKAQRSGDRCEVTSRALPTFDRRLDCAPGGMIAPVDNPAYSAAYAVDPFYAVLEERSGVYFPPPLSHDRIKMATELIKRISGEATGAAAVKQFTNLFAKRFPEEMQMFVNGIAKGDTEQPQPEVGTKRQRAEVPSASERMRVWEKFGTAVPELRDVVIRLLSAHATSAATERNWSLWGRIYVASRSSTAMQTSKCMISICAAEKAKQSPGQVLELTLKVVEKDV